MKTQKTISTKKKSTGGKSLNFGKSSTAGKRPPTFTRKAAAAAEKEAKSKAPAKKKTPKSFDRFIPRPTRKNPLTPTTATKDDYPMRINKYLALKGYSTRRGADLLVEKGFVTIDGKTASLGDAVANAKSVVVVKDKGGNAETPNSASYRYIAFNKPTGIITHSPQGDDEQDILDLIRKDNELRKLSLFPIGRLDKASHGLIILTNDGRITDRMLNPDKPHEKEYAVKVQERPRPSFAEHMSRGVTLEDGYITRPAKVTMTGETIFRIVLTEGKKHQIRRMVSAMHNTCIDIRRVRVLNIKLGDLAPGKWREIDGPERSIFLKSLGLAE